MRRSSFISIAMMVLGITVAGCRPSLRLPAPTPFPLIPAKELLLDRRPFPADWIADPCGSDCEKDEGDTYATRNFGSANLKLSGHAFQEVFRLETVRDAAAMFQRSREADFSKHAPPQVPSTDLLPPPGSYQSPFADNYYFGCGVNIEPRCQASMRYGNYFVSFFCTVDRGEADGVPITGEGLTIAQVEAVLRALDARVAERLGIRSKGLEPPQPR